MSEIVHFSGHIAGSPASAAVPISLRSVSNIWACVSVRGLLWAVWLASGTVCAAACAVQSVRVRWGHLRGMGPEDRVGAVSPVSSDQNKKGVFGVPLTNTHPFFTNQNPSNCASLQKFQKIQKGPFRSLDCAIIR
jgi:hypothetical protein